jgi:hypothetical protein
VKRARSARLLGYHSILPPGLKILCRASSYFGFKLRRCALLCLGTGYRCFAVEC